MDEPALLVLWESVTGDILSRTALFPRSARFSFARRIEDRTLDVLECLAGARFAPRAHRSELLLRADEHLSVLRVLLRVSHSRKLLSTGALEHLARRLAEAGAMLGGWRQHLDGQ